MATDDFQIHCFEPSRKTFKMLVASFSTADKRITLNKFGIGKERGEKLLYCEDFGSGLASLTKRKLDHFNIDFNKSEKAGIETIDNYCSENSIGQIHLRKLDIEGHELDALAGAKEMPSTKSIDVVTFEFGGCNIDTRTFFQVFWYFFKTAHFALFRNTPSGYLYPLKSYREFQEPFRTTNFMAIANG